MSVEQTRVFEYLVNPRLQVFGTQAKPLGDDLADATHYKAQQQLYEGQSDDYFEDG